MNINPIQGAWRTRAVSFVLAAGLLIFFAVIATIIIKSKPEPKTADLRENVFAVRAHTATIGSVRPSAILTGAAQARDYAVLTAPVEAEVLNIVVREGDSFAAGRRLVQLDLREQQFQAQARQTAVETAKLRITALSQNRNADILRLAETRNLLDLAENDYKRNVTLQTKNLVTRTQIENAETAVSQRRSELVALKNRVDNYPTEEKLLQQELAAAEVALAQANLLIERGEMRAPFAGKVSRVHASAGSVPARGAALMEIFNPKNVRLRALVPNRHVQALQGGDARAVLSTGAATLALANVSPRAEAGQGSVEAFFELPSGDWVLGATFEFQLQLPALNDALELPFDSLYAESQIYKIDEEKRARGVRCERLGVSRKDAGIFALLRCPDINEGDLIIATQRPGLAEGAKVRVIGGTE